MNILCIINPFSDGPTHGDGPMHGDGPTHGDVLCYNVYTQFLMCL